MTDLASKTRVLWMAVAVVGTGYVGVALPYPILAPLFLEAHAQSGIVPTGITPELALGLVLALYPLGMFFGNQILGSLADIAGRKRALLLSLSGSCAGYLLSAFALEQDSYALLLISRVATGFFEGNVPIARAIAADLAPDIPKETSFGYISGAVYLGYLVGPLVGGVLGSLSYSVPFALAGALFAALTLGVAGLLKADHGRQTKDAERQSLNPWGLLRTRIVRQFFFANLVASLSVSLFYQFYPLVLVKKHGFDSPLIGAITFAMTAALLVASIWGIRLIARSIGHIPTIIGASAIFAALLAATTLSSNEIALWLAFVGIGFVIPLIQTNITIYTSNQLGADVQGRLMGLLGAGGAFGAAAVIILGSFAAGYEASIPILAGSLLAIASAMYLAIITRPLRTSGEPRAVHGPLAAEEMGD